MGEETGKKTTVVVMGAGAMGCLIGGKLQEGGLDVTFVDKWQAHVDAMNKDGLKLTGVGGERVLKVKATTDVASLGKVDVVIVQCKSADTRAATESAKHLFHDETVAVSFQNGLGNEDIMVEVLGDVKKVFGGQTLEGANVVGPGVVRVHTNLPSYMGEWAGGCSERCGRLARIFTEAGLTTHEEADIKKKVWMKVIYNCVVSPLSAIMNLAHRDVYCRNDSGYVADKIIQEVLQVARAEGVAISDSEGRECLDKVIASDQANKSSMAMDIDSKRVSEMDFINGRITLLGERHGIDVPFNRTMVFFIKGLESHFAEPKDVPKVNGAYPAK